MRLTIYAGKAFSADFTVVSTDGITPLVLDPNDTAVFSLSTNGVTPTIVLQDIALVIIDAANGLFSLTLSAEDTASLKQDIGAKEDKYSLLSNYLGLIDFSLVAGDRQASMDMYVREVGV